VLAGELDPTSLLQAGAVAKEQDGKYHRFTAPDAKAAILALGKLLQDPGVTLVDLQMKHPSLEDVYLELMGTLTPKQREDA